MGKEGRRGERRREEEVSEVDGKGGEERRGVEWMGEEGRGKEGWFHIIDYLTIQSIVLSPLFQFWKLIRKAMFRDIL